MTQSALTNKDVRDKVLAWEDSEDPAYRPFPSNTPEEVVHWFSLGEKKETLTKNKKRKT
jgi:hypothetical protein